MRTLDFDVADCLPRVRLCDQDAARSLVEYLRPIVIRIVRRKLPRGAAEEDLAQEIFLKVFEKLNQFRGKVPLEHWVSRIAVNHCLNAIRSRRARPEWRMADLSEEQEAALEPRSRTMEQSHPAYSLDSREFVEKILQSLGPEDRLIIRMLDLEGLTMADVQQATGCSAARIRLRAFRARQRLNKRFAPLRQRDADGFATVLLNQRLPTPCLA